MLHQPNVSHTDYNQSPKSNKNQGEEISAEKRIGTLVMSQSENKRLQPAEKQVEGREHTHSLPLRLLKLQYQLINHFICLN